jgi:hypothetical protein
MEATIDGSVGFGLGGTVTSTMEASVDGVVAFSFGGTVTATMEAAVDGAAAFPIAGTTTATMEATIDGAVAFLVGGTTTSTMEATIDGAVASDVEAIIGTEGEQLELEVANVDALGYLTVHAGSTRPVRFNLVSAAGTTVDPAVVDTIIAQLRRASDPTGAMVEIEPEQDEGIVGETTYAWVLDLSTIDVGGLWVLELDVVLTGGLGATWPSAGPLRIRAVEGV